MEIKYFVEGKEFSNIAEATKYENELRISKSKFKVNDDVYYYNDSKLIKRKIKKVDYLYSDIIYYFYGKTSGTYENSGKIFKTFEDFCEHMKSNIIDETIKGDE